MRPQVSPTLIRGLVLLTAGGLMLPARLEALPMAAAVWTVVLAAVGVGSGYAFVTDRYRWWAAIPAGATTTLALVVGASAMTTSRTGDVAVGALFLLGLAATFALVAVDPGGARRWAYVPAAVLAAIGVVPGWKPWRVFP